MITENERKVYEVLCNLGISYTKYEHDPVYTIEEANNLDVNIIGKHCKNLFIRNRKGNKHYLVIVIDSKRVNLKLLSSEIESTSLSLASEKRLFKYLGLKPGAVSPFGLINDTTKHVEVLIDEDLIGSDIIGFHPNVNTATITISYDDFRKFIDWCGNKVSHVQID
ncbi:prolyl-tRNA synthetase associated domain-containing protein [Maledivibacter halophilus]|uniref:Ala-tRNA(Pro) hydrolase n=1 Tax=Maledivibacter halophilus TaxID=36842 RepID=A0A1T5MA81_9FIRM|nr:prolyl-tRNA synthetase associated domain-containing protein [Maledivibacter halophilus]SKC84738.1 Ala-tRNA(Pro) hydrolase [Maledivibacter halophilus]